MGRLPDGALSIKVVLFYFQDLNDDGSVLTGALVRVTLPAKREGTMLRRRGLGQARETEWAAARD